MNLKYIVDNKSLRQYCIEHGKTESFYKNCVWLVQNKFLTPLEAFNYQKNKSPFDRKTQCLRAHRRFLGYSENELNLSTDEIKEIGLAKRGTIFYHGHTIGWWAKKYNISTGCLNYRIKKMGMSILEAVSEPTKSQKTLKYKGKSIYEIFDSKTAQRIRNRVLYSGWSLEDAIKIPKLSREEINKLVKLRIFAKLYPNGWSARKLKKFFAKYD